MNKYFPGGNTGEGFYNLFEGLIPKGEEAKIYILKGGPGVGKNTLMKKVAQKAEKAGFEVEYFFCSGDPDSLDAVRIIDKNVVIVDGTAPHIIDPVFPGVADEIVNLGVFINKDIVNEVDILRPFFEENKRQYTVAYSYLSTASLLKASNFRAYESIYSKSMMKSFIEKQFANIKPSEGIVKRKLFLNAITCKGAVSLLSDLKAKENVYVVKGEGKLVFVNVLAKVMEKANMEIYYDALLPKNPAHIHFLEEDVWVVSEDVEGKPEINVEEFLLGKIQDYVTFNNAQISELVKKAISHLEVCKSSHDEIENVYKKYMDFEGVKAVTENLMNEMGLN